MNPERTDFRHTLIGGVVATLTITVLMYLTPLVGLPKIDMASALGGFLSDPAGVLGFRWWIGMAGFLVFGIVISPVAFLYALPAFYGKPWVRGLQWGVLLWVFGGIMGMIFGGLGFHEPFVSRPHAATLASFLGHLIYGAVLGEVSARAVVHLTAQEKHA